jgi:hypothetical protein
MEVVSWLSLFNRETHDRNGIHTYRDTDTFHLLQIGRSMVPKIRDFSEEGLRISPLLRPFQEASDVASGILAKHSAGEHDHHRAFDLMPTYQ